MCTYCGKPFCNECLVEVKGRMYCKADIGNVMDEVAGSSPASSNTPVINITNTSSNMNQNTATAIAGHGMGLPPKSKMVTLLLCIFLGVLGAHRFYTGKTGSGLLYLFTCGLAGVGVIIDLIMILTGGFRDRWGVPLA